jgi:hypothetical protein
LTGSVNPQNLTLNTSQSVTAGFQSTAAANDTGQVTVALGGFRVNRATGLYTQVVTLTNTGAAMAGPVSLAFDNLTAGVHLSNPAGSTSCTSPPGSPYATVSTGTWGSGQMLSVTVSFSVTTPTAISYTPRILAGTGQ